MLPFFSRDEASRGGSVSAPGLRSIFAAEITVIRRLEVTQVEGSEWLIPSYSISRPTWYFWFLVASATRGFFIFVTTLLIPMPRMVANNMALLLASYDVHTSRASAFNVLEHEISVEVFGNISFHSFFVGSWSSSRSWPEKIAHTFGSMI